MTCSSLFCSRALWNRSQLDLNSVEIIAQILDRGSIEDWRELYRLAKSDTALAQRIATVVQSVPLPMPHFWIAALRNLSIEIDWKAPNLDYENSNV